MSAPAGDLTGLSIVELGAGYLKRTFSAVEVVTAYLDRIQKLDRAIRTYITVLAEDAITAARAADARSLAGNRLSALDGIPIGLKDAIDIAGVVTTANSRHFISRIRTTDSAVGRAD